MSLGVCAVEVVEYKKRLSNKYFYFSRLIIMEGIGRWNYRKGTSKMLTLKLRLTLGETSA